MIAIRRTIFFVASFNIAINIFKCLTNGVPFSHYIFYIATLFVMMILVLFYDNKYILSFVLAVIGFLTYADSQPLTSFSGGIIFLLFAIDIVKDKVFRNCIYAIMAALTLSLFIVYDIELSSTINRSMVNILVFYLHYKLNIVREAGIEATTGKINDERD